MRIFSAAAFLASDSGKSLKAIIGGRHIEILDGMPVQECKDGFGEIQYKVDGKSWELYPVMPEWCVNDTQQRLF